MLIHCLPKDLLGSKASDPVKEQCRPLYLTTTATDQTASLSGDGKPTLIEMALDALAACLEASPLQAPKAKLEEALQPLTAYYSSPSLLARSTKSTRPCCLDPAALAAPSTHRSCR